jgi:hypothetical protein
LGLFIFLNVNSSFASNSKSQLWQWGTTLSLTDASGKNYTVSPYLWIPPKCQKVNAVIFASTAVIEQTLVESAEIRSVCSNYNIAIVWSDTQFYHDETTGLKQIQNILNRFADISGYEELKTVPWIPIGHSATLKMIRDMARLKMDKLAFMIMNKNNNGFGYSPAVPTLTTYGEYVEWDSYNIDLRVPITKEKSYPNIVKARTDNQLLISYYFDPNTGHFDCREELIKNIANWMNAICGVRFDSIGQLKSVFQEQGWVCQPPVPGFSGFLPKKYEGASFSERNNAWFPNYETALAAFMMANVKMNRKTQFAGFADSYGKYETGWWRAIMYNLPYKLNDNGTIEIFTVPYYKMPQGAYANKFTEDKTSPDAGKLYSFVNKTDSFQNSGNPITVNEMSGNLVKIDNQTFKYVPRFDSPTYLIAREEGNTQFRTSVQPGRLLFKEITNGKANLIKFEEIPDISIKKTIPVKLSATSTSGLPVNFFVGYGAAKIDKNNHLIILKDSLPPRTSFPYEISVTAYQLWSVKKGIKTARSISQKLFLK